MHQLPIYVLPTSELFVSLMKHIVIITIWPKIGNIFFLQFFSELLHLFPQGSLNFDSLIVELHRSVELYVLTTSTYSFHVIAL